MYKSLAEIVETGKMSGKGFWQVVLEDDIKERGITFDEGFRQMKDMYLAMKQADAAYDDKLRSASGMVGTDGGRLEAARIAGGSICGNFMMKVMEKAIKMGESNACMKRIVAAPTAGSCGVIPAVLISMEEEFGYSEDEITKGLIVAAGIGGVIAQRAFLAGAAGGCQAEIGSASAMAAGAAACLKGADGDRIIQAAAIALKNLLGLACDPVGGLVEVPCVKRNTIGAVGALTAADMALAGVDSKIVPDEVIDAMRSIGVAMPSCIKETGNGGLAVTPCAKAMMEKLSQKETETENC
mgnify:FL=1